MATVPFSIIKQGNLDLNEYYTILVDSYPQPDDPSLTPYYLAKVGEKYYSNFPMFGSFLSIPLYLIPSLLDLDQSIETIRVMSRVSGAFSTAFSVGFMYLIISKKVKKTSNVLLLVAIYAFATNNLSTSSQGLWQQSTSVFFITWALLSLYNKKLFLAGLLLGFSYAARPTNAISVVMIGLYIIWDSKDILRSGLRYLVGVIVAVLLDFALNYRLFGSILNAGYNDQFHNFSENLLVGMTGLWISPSKGVLIVSPIIIFIFYGIWYYLKRYKSFKLEVVLIAIVVLHTIVLGKWYSWYGGYSWGYRMITEMTPIMVIMLIPFVESKYFRMKFWKILFYSLAILSFAIQCLGVISSDGHWHTIYDYHGGRSYFWSIKESQLVFSVRRILHKLSLGSSPYPPGF